MAQLNAKEVPFEELSTFGHYVSGTKVTEQPEILFARLDLGEVMTKAVSYTHLDVYKRQGCNIENAAFTPTNCAERTAFFQAVSQGEREFSAIAIVGGRAGETCAQICPPCGICRQVMREFCTDDFLIYLGRQTSEGEISYQTMTLGQLLPESFGPDNL